MDIGSIMGDVMGELEDQGLSGAVLGQVEAAVARVARKVGTQVTVHKPHWRNGELAPGVMAPGEGKVPIGMVAQAGGGTFTATLSSIDFVGRNQKPFKPVRILATTVRTGASATGRLLTKMYVGTDLMQGTLAAIDLELIGAPTSFDTEVDFLQGPPGVEVTFSIVLSAAPTGGDTIFATMMCLGKIVH